VNKKAKVMKALHGINHRQQGAFSLIELLTVIAILSILLALAIPPISQVMKSADLTNAGDQIVSTLSLARHTAISRNRAVEVRFYKYAETADPADGRFHAMQLFFLEPSSGGTTATSIGRKISFPSTVYISSTAILSSLMDPTVTTQASGASLNQSIPTQGKNYQAASFRFYPDGSTNLPSNRPLFLTVVPSNTEDTATSLPANYATIVIQKATGKAQIHRP
jgi:uncharacterized protein (TIGR02596 family)